VSLGTEPPTVGGYFFVGIDSAQTVTVKVPSGGVANYTDEWKSAFRGKGNIADEDSGKENTYITVIVAEAP